MYSKMDRASAPTSSSRLELVVRPAQLPDDISHKPFGVPEKHQRAVEVVERVIDTSKAGTHAALDDHDSPSFIDIENRHSVNGTAGFVARRGICDVIR